MKVFDIIIEAGTPPVPPPPRIINYRFDGQYLIDPATGKHVTAAEILAKIKPEEAKKLSAAVAARWMQSKIYSTFGWIFKTVTSYSPIAIAWAYEMASINFLFDSGYIGPIGKYNAGEVAQQMRKAVTKDYMAQMLATLSVLGTIGGLRMVMKVAGQAQIAEALGYLTGGGKLGFLKAVSSIAFQAALFALFSSETFRKYMVRYFLEQVFPDFWSTVADLIQGPGAYVPATIAPVVDQAADAAKKAGGDVLDKGKEKVGVTPSPRQLAPTDAEFGGNKSVTDQDIEKFKQEKPNF